MSLPEQFQPLLERQWSHAGIECAIARSPKLGKNGYVRLPAPVPASAIALIRPEITYGPDPNGWIGFDTGHGWDVWVPDAPDGPLSPLEEAARRQGQRVELEPLPDAEWMEVWTTEKLADAVEALADHVAAWLAASVTRGEECDG